MPHRPHRIFQDARECDSTAIAARRLQLEYIRLQHRLVASHHRRGAEAETNVLRERVDQIARELGSIHADSVHAVESKLKVALDLADGHIGKASHKLFASALSDLHYLALMSEQPAKRG